MCRNVPRINKLCIDVECRVQPQHRCELCYGEMFPWWRMSSAVSEGFMERMWRIPLNSVILSLIKTSPEELSGHKPLSTVRGSGLDVGLWRWAWSSWSKEGRCSFVMQVSMNRLVLSPPAGENQHGFNSIGVGWWTCGFRMCKHGFGLVFYPCKALCVPSNEWKDLHG